MFLLLLFLLFFLLPTKIKTPLVIFHKVTKVRVNSKILLLSLLPEWQGLLSSSTSEHDLLAICPGKVGGQHSIVSLCQPHRPVIESSIVYIL